MTPAERPEFQEIVARHDRRLFNLLLRLTGNYHAAEDLSQEVFLIAFREYPKFRGEADVYTWLYRIAINHHRRHVRKARLKQWLGLDEIPEGEMAVKDGDDPLEKDEKSREVSRAVAALPVEFKEAIVLHYFQEHSCERVAEILDCSEGTVKSRLWRGRKILEKKLKGFVAEAGV